MKSNQSKSAFFGIFDPDGRPWGQSGNLSNFQKGLESALKIAFLTQRQLIIPSGYFLDNPALQRIFTKYKGSDDESQSFRALCSDLLRISLNESLHDGPQDKIDWQGTWDSWIRGTSSNRGQLVYLNCLAPDDAEEIQTHADVNEFKRLMTAALSQQQGIDFNEYLRTLSQLGLSTVHQPPFEFDKLLRTLLLNREESFPDFREPLFEKLQAAAEATSSAEIRMSRSLLNNPILSLEIGIPETQVIKRAEYKSIAGILGHYHHYAFAKALELDAFTTFKIPTPEKRSAELLLKSVNSLSKPTFRKDEAHSLVWPLTKVSFNDIWKVRLGVGQTRFFDSLNSVYDNALGSEVQAYNKALYAHARTVAGIIALDFGSSPPDQVAQDVSEDLSKAYTGANNAVSAALSARKLLPYFKDFSLNIRKELQLRFFFRSLS